MQFKFNLLLIFAFVYLVTSCDLVDHSDSSYTTTLKGRVFSIELDSSNHKADDRRYYKVDSIGLEKVKVALNPNGKFETNTVTDSMGRFQFKVNNGEHNLRVNSDGFQKIDTVINVSTASSSDDQNVSINLWMKKEPRSVFTIDGKVLRKANETTYSVDAKVLLDKFREKSTGAEGKFRFFVNKGPHDLQVIAKNYPDFDTTLVSERDHQLTVVLESNTLSGAVYESKLVYGLKDTADFEFGYLVKKEGISDAMVKVGNKEIRTDKNGEYELKEIEENEVEMIVNHEYYHGNKKSLIIDGDTTINIELKPVMGNYLPLNQGNYWIYDYWYKKTQISYEDIIKGKLIWTVIEKSFKDSAYYYTIAVVSG